MPHSPNDVFIARYQGSLAVQESSDFIFELSSGQFIFRSILDEVKYKKPTQWYSGFSGKSTAKNQLIIGLAYAPDGAEPQQYQVISFATLNCKNDQFVISKPIAPFLAWNKQTSNCSTGDRAEVGILDGFIDYDQTHYLAQLQQKYPTCEQLNKAFPLFEMEENSQDWNLLSNWKLWWAKLINQIKSWF
ncbi:MAG: hypothetical protein Q4F77_04400 [Acinetobacter sp.]|uniref:hypothetical protein n=1 Tax=Acinetobacter sp. TaxID=472 RepID=UPI0026DF19B9|nr:hypothetical protein [Acinetobacter sp.]MDO5542533.1 hypothetical protein [Acinetobacter sp.]